VTAINWTEVVQLKSPPQLARFGGYQLIQKNIYALDDNAFAFTYEDFKKSQAREMMIAIFYWAPSSSAFFSVLNRNRALDDGVSIPPPRALLLDGWRRTHRDILALCNGAEAPLFKTSKVLNGQEVAYRKISVGIFDYFFRSIDEENEDDEAFVIAVDLRDIRWAKAGSIIPRK
jgi:hypothetical protein